MRNKLLNSFVAMMCITLSTACGYALAQEQTTEGDAPPAIPAGGRPEYTPKKLPNDTFKPSEKISEDFPVPFPVDI